MDINLVLGPSPGRRFKMTINRLAWVAYVVLAAGYAQAQVAGGIAGSVVDNTGAAIPNAKVSLMLSGGKNNVRRER